VGAPAASGRLREQLSGVLRDELLAELARVGRSDEAALWARKTPPAKNTLTDQDARLVEGAFARRLASFDAPPEIDEAATPGSVPQSTTGPSANDAARSLALASGGPHVPALEIPAEPTGIDKSALTIGNARRCRDKAHLKFVAGEPCLVCGRKPCDPHHLRFTQKRALGRKVSDEFTVPLCRTHHRDLHRSGDEALWWQTIGLDPTNAARKLWEDTRVKREAESKRPRRRSEAVVLNLDPAGGLAQPSPDAATARPQSAAGPR